MRFILLSILLHLCVTACAQNLEGVWRISHVQSIDSTISKDIDSTYRKNINSDIIVETIEDNIYTRFDEISGIIEIFNSKVISHNFISKPKKAKIKSRNGDFYFKLDGEKVKIEQYSNDSLLFKNDKDPYSFAVLYPFQSNGSKIQEKEFQNTSWSLSTTYKYLNDFTYHFQDSNVVAIVKRGESNGYTHDGEWKLYSSNQYHCLCLRDFINMEDHIFYLKKKEKNELSMVIGHQFFLEHPKQIDLVLKSIDKPNVDDLVKIKNDFVGKWNFESFTNSTNILVIDSLISITLSFEFNNDQTYRLKNQHRFIEYGSKEIQEFSHNEKGSWELSDSGDFVIIYPTDSWKRNLTIYSLSAEEAILDLSFRISEYGFVSTRVCMSKENNSRQ